MKDVFNWDNNHVFFGDRAKTFGIIKEQAEKDNSQIFEIEKLNISVDDIRRMISFVNKGSEEKKVVLLSSFYWADEAQNAMLKVLEETPPNTVIFLFGLSEKNFLKTVLSRVQKVYLKNTNRYLDIAKEVLSLPSNERLENKNVKKILALKVVDYNFEKNTENEKKDREAHILFLYALIEIFKTNIRPTAENKKIFEQILQITTLAEIEGGGPHLFVEWLLLSVPPLS